MISLKGQPTEALVLHGGNSSPQPVTRKIENLRPRLGKGGAEARTSRNALGMWVLLPPRGEQVCKPRCEKQDTVYFQSQEA